MVTHVQNSAPSAESQARPLERAWVLEHGDSPTSQPRYWAAGQIDPLRSSAWTENFMAAIRFAREEDGRAVADRMMKKREIPVRVCQHIWTA